MDIRTKYKLSQSVYFKRGDKWSWLNGTVNTISIEVNQYKPTKIRYTILVGAALHLVYEDEIYLFIPT